MEQLKLIWHELHPFIPVISVVLCAHIPLHGASRLAPRSRTITVTVFLLLTVAWGILVPYYFELASGKPREELLPTLNSLVLFLAGRFVHRIAKPGWHSVPLENLSAWLLYILGLFDLISSRLFQGQLW